MRLTKLCITVALALGGWHGALASALCARHADCHASASTRAPHAPGRSLNTSDQTHAHPHASAADEHDQTASRAAADLSNDLTNAPTNDHTNRQNHCGSSAKDSRAVAHAAPLGAETEAAQGDDDNASARSVTDLRAPSVTELRAPDSSCGHCVGRQSDQPARVSPAAPGFARDSHVTPPPTQRLVTLPQTAPRPRSAPTGHAPPRGRPLHLLNSALLI